MEAFLNKCSICFDTDSELELGLCGDQFCFACFESWLHYQFQRSWGIQAIALWCPVCRLEVEEEDWAPWVSRSIYEEYLHLLERSRDLIRQCPSCQHAQKLAGDPGQRALYSLIAHLTPLSLQSRMLRLANLGAYHSMLEVMAQQMEASNLRIQMTRAILSEASPVAWPSLQLAVLRLMPQSQCDQCQGQLCMRCSAPTWHLGKPCEPPSLPDGWYALHLTFFFSRVCPLCWTGTEKSEDGCNEMQCSLCGHRYCWSCGRPWSIECGLYECRMAGPSHTRPHRGVVIPEAGVPDVERLRPSL